MLTRYRPSEGIIGVRDDDEECHITLRSRRFPQRPGAAPVPSRVESGKERRLRQRAELLVVLCRIGVGKPNSHLLPHSDLSPIEELRFRLEQSELRP